MTKPKPYKFKPTKELLHFATWFSENYKTLAPGIYKSKNDIYIIELFKKDNEISPRSFDVARNSKIFYFSKDKIKTVSKNGIFYLVIWMAIHLDLFHDYKLTDKHAIKYYLTIKRSKKDLVKVNVDLWVPYGTQLNIDRLKYLLKTASK